MPDFVRLQLLEEPEDATTQGLCTKATEKLIFGVLCTVDDWSRYEFKEKSSESSEKFQMVLTKMSENQNSVGNRIDDLTQKLNSPKQLTSKKNYRDNQQQTWRGKFRGRTNKKRTNRGYSINHGYQYNRNHQNNQNQGTSNYQNNQNRGKYGNNSLQETTEGEITSEVTKEELSRIAATITSIYQYSAARLSKQRNNNKYWKLRKTY